MDETSSQSMLSWWSLESAYKALDIRDPTTSDGNVVAVFHQRYSTLAPPAQINLIGALELISFRRQSRLLAFILTIVPHLTKENVALLATPPTTSTASLLNSRQQPSGNANLNRVVIPATTAQQSRAQAVAVNPVVPTPTSNNEPTAAAGDSADDLSINTVDNMSVLSEENYSACFYNSSSEENDDSTDYESEESIAGRYWNGQRWCCDECDNGLVEGECPLGHDLNPCKVCEEYLEDCTCDKSQSASDEEGGLAGDEHMMWDDQDGIWRCTACLWEVEANSEDNGECQCVSNDTSARAIELLYYHDYEPADSDSSGPESDYETDSGDESFIDDEGPFGSSLLDMTSHPSQARDDLEQESRSATVQEEEGPIQSIEAESMDTT